MTDPDDTIDTLAGEYVLGTLDAAERADVAARRLHDTTLDAAIGEWEIRLAPLGLITAAVSPPAGVFQRIEQRLSDPVQAREPNGTQEATMVIVWRRRADRWRRIGITATALAASLVAWTVWREATLNAFPDRYVGVFAQDDVLPRFYLTIDLKTRELTIRPVGAKQQPGKTYQLWIASEKLGGAPQSLGLMEDSLASTTKVLSQYDPALLHSATFGVSLEPEGGSPTGRPSPGALHTKLLPIAH